MNLWIVTKRSNFTLGAELRVSYLLIEFSDSIVALSQNSRTEHLPSISISPSVIGEWHWSDPRTLRFDGKFSLSTAYTITVLLLPSFLSSS